jgi:hypothetical protein
MTEQHLPLHTYKLEQTVATKDEENNSLGTFSFFFFIKA